MQKPKNCRMIVGGVVFLIGAICFFMVMMRAAPHSNDPVGMLQTVGQVCGVVGTIGAGLIVAGLLGWQGLSKRPQ